MAATDWRVAGRQNPNGILDSHKLPTAKLFSLAEAVGAAPFGRPHGFMRSGLIAAEKGKTRNES